MTAFSELDLADIDSVGVDIEVVAIGATRRVCISFHPVPARRLNIALGKALHRSSLFVQWGGCRIAGVTQVLVGIEDLIGRPGSAADLAVMGQFRFHRLCRRTVFGSC